MSNGELVAWQAGCDWSRDGLSRTAYATSSVATLTQLCGADVGEAIQEMGRDVFSHWFLTGLRDHEAATNPDLQRRLGKMREAFRRFSNPPTD